MSRLSDYEKRRKFKETPEPKNGSIKSSDINLPIFVVQKHSASHLHYDLRLEHKCILLSWAVPKGFSMNSEEKRLAVKVEDHPFSYRDFEGVIPEGNYGAGSVMVWDEGFYSSGALDKKLTEKNIKAGLDKGHLSFSLAGQKLRGTFDLVKLKTARDDWLLLKRKDEFASDRPMEFAQHSVKSGLEMEEIELGKKAPMPHNIRPMTAHTSTEPFDRSGWIFEVKWDGYRAIAEIENGKVRLYSRNLQLFNERFPEISQSLLNINKDAVLDGEIVIVSKEGKSDFQALQEFEKSRRGRLVYYVFDLLYFDGHDLRDKPLMERKTMLKKVVSGISNIKYSDHVPDDGKSFYEAVKEAGLEGIMAKDAKSPYVSGRRSSKWLKIKTQKTAEAIIIGYTMPTSGRKYFGSLILGMYDLDGNLSYIGNVGTGFTDRKILELFKKFEALIQEKSPIFPPPKVNTPAVWLKPELVCTVKYSEWTREEVLRQPVFLNLRDDIDPLEVKKDEQKFKFV